MIVERNPLLDLLGIRLPIIQAPMAGVSTPAMAAAVTKAGGLGSLGMGATDAEGARAMIAAVREVTSGPLNVNLFCHKPAVANAAVEAAWIEVSHRIRNSWGQATSHPHGDLPEFRRR